MSQESVRETTHCGCSGGCASGSMPTPIRSADANITQGRENSVYLIPTIFQPWIARTRETISVVPWLGFGAFVPGVFNCRRVR